MQVRVDRLEPRQERDREERHPAPGVDPDGAPHRPAPVGEERELVRDEAKAVEEPVHHAERGIDHPPPGERREHGRHDERQQHRGADQTHAAELAVQEESEPHAEGQLEDRRPERVEERVLEGGLEDRVVPLLDEVPEPDEGARAAHARVAEGEPDAHHERVGDEQGEQHDRGRQEEGGQQPLALEAPRQPPRGRRPRPGQRDLDRGSGPYRRDEGARVLSHRSSGARRPPTPPRPPRSGPAPPSRTCRR